MRILITNYEYPPLGGGASNATAHLAQELAQLDHDVFVMTSRFGNLPHAERRDGYTVIRIPVLRRAVERSNPFEMLTYLFSSMWHILRLRRRITPDYTIAFFGIPSAPAAWLLKLIYGVPYIVSLRGGDVPGHQPEDLKNFHRLTKPIIQFLWWQAEHVVANSQGLANLAHKSRPMRPIHVVPNGVDTKYFSPSPALSHGKLMFAGRLAREKGLPYLVEAVAKLTPDEREKLSITLVGDGPLRDQLSDMMQQLGVQPCFEFAGWKDRDQIVTYYQRQGGFILPSLYEGMSNVLLEAMACGLPIIATGIPSNEELVQDNGFLVLPQDSDALAGAIRQWLGDPAMAQQMGRASRKAAESYSWRGVAEKYLDLMR